MTLESARLEALRLAREELAKTDMAERCRLHGFRVEAASMLTRLFGSCC